MGDWLGAGSGAKLITHTRNVHHDALELPDGQIVLVTKLAAGQHATVLQLPASPCENMPETELHEQVIKIVPADW